MNTVILSRCDRIGDLVLSLPALGLLGQAGFVRRILHCSQYASDIGFWALHNKLCEEVWIAGTKVPSGLSHNTPAIALFPNSQTSSDYRKAGLKNTFSPRTKLSTLWLYNKTFSQKRSRVEKSEMHYNLDLVRLVLDSMSIHVPEFIGLPALNIPSEWKSKKQSPHTVICVSNSASASNWGIQQYIDFGKNIFQDAGGKVDFLVSGHDAMLRKQGILESGILRQGFGMVESFPNLRELVSYLGGANFVVASSTGPLHIAHAAGVNVLGLYPSERVQSFDRWRPDGYWHKGFVRYQIIS